MLLTIRHSIPRPLEPRPAAARQQELRLVGLDQADLPRRVPGPVAHPLLLPEVRVVVLEDLPDLPEREPGVLDRALF